MKGSSKGISQMLKDAGNPDYKNPAMWDYVRKLNKLDSRYTVYGSKQYQIPTVGLKSLNSTSSTAPSVAPTSTAPAKTPANSTELKEYLNDWQTQKNTLENYDAFGEDAPTGEDIDNFAEDKLGMEGEAPVAPKFEETFNKLREDMGLDSIEAGINEYKNMIREQENLLMQQKNSERGKTVRMGVIEGRVDQATRDRQEQISWLASNVSYLTDVANSAYNLINMTMQFKQMDYQTAKEAYDSEFSKRLSIRQSILDEQRDERDFKYQMMKDQQAVAQTQLSMFAEMITKGQMSWDKMSTDEQLAIHKLEVQSGLGVGFLSKVQIPKDSTIKSISNRTDPSGNTWADILYVDPVTGATEVKHELLGKTKVSGGGGTSTVKNAYGYTASQWSSKVSEAMKELQKFEAGKQKEIWGSGSGDRMMAQWEIDELESQFIGTYGKGVGSQLLAEAMNKGGYSLWQG